MASTPLQQIQLGQERLEAGETLKALLTLSQLEYWRFPRHLLRNAQGLRAQCEHALIDSLAPVTSELRPALAELLAELTMEQKTNG